MCDRTAWGVELCKQVGSDRFRLLYDIYHMQIMEGDVIRTIREHSKYINHYHTAGNPGRSNLDDTQELNYRGICEAIVATGFTGWIAQEFTPRGDAAEALGKAVRICDV
jgi:hydroxypyruvate isomerase